MNKLKKLFALLLTAVMLASMFTLLAAAEENTDAQGTSDQVEPCVDGKHQPGGDLQPADYTECTGGYKKAYYVCSMCGLYCHDDGTEAKREESNGAHTPGFKIEADYTECGGGFKEDYYLCTQCGRACDANGTDIGMKEEPGSGKHTLGNNMRKADYSECGGGYKVDHYVCSVCSLPCDKDGTVINWFPGNGRHTPGVAHSADYTECGGGYKEDYYRCAFCAADCDASGNKMTKEPGSGKHTLGATEYPADYTVCGGGYITAYFHCSKCPMYCDQNGNVVWPELGSEKHTPGATEYPADYTVCGGGIQETYYYCTVCNTPCTKDGQLAGWLKGTAPHKLVTVPAKAATVEAEGNIEYVMCSVCENIYKNAADAEKGTACKLEEVTLPKLLNQKVEVEKGIEAVPSQIADKYETVTAMETAMTQVAIESTEKLDSEKAQTELIDVTLKIQKSDGQWETVTPENFPEEGITTLLPYPEGTDKNSHDFVVAHMITTGDKAGQVEILNCIPEDDGLRVTFSSLSPVMIMYQEKTDVQADSSQGSTTTENSPKTGDESATLLWAAVLILSGAAAISLGRKKSYL